VPAMQGLEMTYVRIEIDSRFGITVLVVLLLVVTGLVSYKYGYKRGHEAGIESALDTIRNAGQPLDNHRY
jgi:hypothetical protein